MVISKRALTLKLETQVGFVRGWSILAKRSSGKTGQLLAKCLQSNLVGICLFEIVNCQFLSLAHFELVEVNDGG